MNINKLANKFLKLSIGSKLSSLFNDAINGNLEDWMVFLDALEEEDPKTKERLGWCSSQFAPEAFIDRLKCQLDALHRAGLLKCCPFMIPGVGKIQIIKDEWIFKPIDNKYTIKYSNHNYQYKIKSQEFDKFEESLTVFIYTNDDEFSVSLTSQSGNIFPPFGHLTENEQRELESLSRAFIDDANIRLKNLSQRLLVPTHAGYSYE